MTIPVKLTDLGGGAGRIEEFAASDKVPDSNLSANLEAFGGLSGVADRLPYFTGAGALSLATLTSFARTLLDDADALAVGNTLGLVKQTSALDTTAGSLLTVGSFGIGANVVATDSDANAGSYIIPGAHFLSSSGGTNFPPAGSSRCLVHVVGGVGGGLSQVFTARDTGDSYVRVYNSVSWLPWRKVYTQGTILGTVSQSAGIPTGAIIERGSNANGEYVRYADGTQICWKRVTAISCVAGNDLAVSWTLPAVLSDAGSAIAQVSVAAPITTNGYTVDKLQAVTGGTGIVNMRIQFSVTQDYQVSYFLTGRWY